MLLVGLLVGHRLLVGLDSAYGPSVRSAMATPTHGCAVKRSDLVTTSFAEIV